MAFGLSVMHCGIECPETINKAKPVSGCIFIVKLVQLILSQFGQEIFMWSLSNFEVLSFSISLGHWVYVSQIYLNIYALNQTLSTVPNTCTFLTGCALVHDSCYD